MITENDASSSNSVAISVQQLSTSSAEPSGLYVSMNINERHRGCGSAVCLVSDAEWILVDKFSDTTSNGFRPSRYGTNDEKCNDLTTK